jgi:hypothetical protein
MASTHKTIKGEPLISTEGLALLLGVDLDELKAEILRQRVDNPTAPFATPTDWVKRGRRTARETMAATDRADLVSCLEHLGADAL